MFFDEQETEESCLSLVASILKRKKNYGHFLVLNNAQVSLIKFKDLDTGIRVDISFN